MARLCEFLHVFALFYAFLRFLMPKRPAEKRNIAQNRAKMFKNAFMQ